MSELFGKDISDIRSFRPGQWETLEQIRNYGETSKSKKGIGAGGTTGGEEQQLQELSSEIPTLESLGMIGHENVPLSSTGVGARGLAFEARTVGGGDTAFANLTDLIEADTSTRDTIGEVSGSGAAGAGIAGEWSPGREMAQKFGLENPMTSHLTGMFTDPLGVVNTVLSKDPAALMNLGTVGIAGHLKSMIDQAVVSKVNDAISNSLDAGFTSGAIDPAAFEAASYSVTQDPRQEHTQMGWAPMTQEEQTAVSLQHEKEHAPKGLFSAIADFFTGPKKTYEERMDLAFGWGPTMEKQEDPWGTVVTPEEELGMWEGLESTTMGEIEMGLSAQAQYEALLEEATRLGIDPNDAALGPTTMGRGWEAWEAYEAKKSQLEALAEAKAKADAEAAQAAATEAGWGNWGDLGGGGSHDTGSGAGTGGGRGGEHESTSDDSGGRGGV